MLDDIKEENELETEEVIEFSSETDDVIDEEVMEKVLPKKKKKFSLKKLSKKGKIILCAVAGVIFLAIVAVVLFLFVFNKEEEKEEETKEPDVILEKNNYRYENGVLIFLDKNDLEIGKYECINKDTDICMTGSYTQDLSLDVNNYMNEENEVLSFDIPIFNERYVVIKDSEEEELIVYDLVNESEVGKFSEIKRYQDNKVIAKNLEGKYGILSFEGEESSNLVDFTYDFLGVNDLYKNIAYKIDSDNGLLDETGAKIVSKLPSDVYSYNDTIIITKTDDEFSLYNYKAESLLDKTYDDGTILNNYAFLVESDELYIFDKDGNKLNEDGIVFTSDLTEVSVFDNNYAKQSELLPLEVALKDEVLELTVDEKIYEINIYEGIINNKYAFVSYFDGYLYFYEDAEKTVLDIKIECTYKNVVTSSESTYDNCFIATESKDLNRVNSKDTLGFIPIYNSRYVFIMDRESVEDSSIKLYDLETNKKIVTYKSVDVGYYNATGNVVAADAANLMIMASNTNGKFGIVKLGTTGLSGMIPFEFSEIEIIEDGFVAKTSSGDYHLFDEFGERITNENVSITSEILDYEGSYIKVKNSEEKYLIYDASGSIISNPFEDIILGKDKFLAETADNKLDVFKYTAGKESILVAQIQMASSNYEFVDNETNGFEIKFYDSDKKLIQTYSFASDGSLKE